MNPTVGPPVPYLSTSFGNNFADANFTSCSTSSGDQELPPEVTSWSTIEPVIGVSTGHSSFGVNLSVKSAVPVSGRIKTNDRSSCKKSSPLNFGVTTSTMQPIFFPLLNSSHFVNNIWPETNPFTSKENSSMANSLHKTEKTLPPSGISIVTSPVEVVATFLVAEILPPSIRQFPSACAALAAIDRNPTAVTSTISPRL